MSEFVKFNVPDDLRNLQTELLKKIAKSGKIKIGINEVTKSIERATAKLVVIAEDVSPAEIVMHLPIIAKEKNIVCSYAKTREELGKSVNISASSSSIAVIDAGVAQKELSSFLAKIKELTSGKSTAKAKQEKSGKAEDKIKKEKVDNIKVEKPKEVKEKIEKKQEAKAEVKEEAKAEAKEEAKPETKVEAKPETKVEAKPETKVEAKEDK